MAQVPGRVPFDGALEPDGDDDPRRPPADHGPVRLSLIVRARQTEPGSSR